jgi:hypothetical protein
VSNLCLVVPVVILTCEALFLGSLIGISRLENETDVLDDGTAFTRLLRKGL